MAGRYAAPLSFAGSANRIARWPQGLTHPWAKALAWTLAILLIVMAWFFVATWYTLAFGLFGLWMVPYRLVRRGQRRRADVARTLMRGREVG
jgi:hypothetical protein